MFDCDRKGLCKQGTSNCVSNNTCYIHYILQCGLCLKQCAIFSTHALTFQLSIKKLTPKILHKCIIFSLKAKLVKGIKIGTYVHASKQEMIMVKFLLDLYNYSWNCWKLTKKN